jgi:hypothetical protein
MHMEIFLPCSERFSLLVFVKIFAKYLDFCNHMALVKQLDRYYHRCSTKKVDISERSSESLTSTFPSTATLLLRVTAVLYVYVHSPFLHKEFLNNLAVDAWI